MLRAQWNRLCGFVRKTFHNGTAQGRGVLTTEPALPPPVPDNQSLTGSSTSRESSTPYHNALAEDDTVLIETPEDVSGNTPSLPIRARSTVPHRLPMSADSEETDDEQLRQRLLMNNASVLTRRALDRRGTVSDPSPIKRKDLSTPGWSSHGKASASAKGPQHGKSSYRNQNNLNTHSRTQSRLSPYRRNPHKDTDQGNSHRVSNESQYDIDDNEYYSATEMQYNRASAPPYNPGYYSEIENSHYNSKSNCRKRHRKVVPRFSESEYNSQYYTPKSNETVHYRKYTNDENEEYVESVTSNSHAKRARRDADKSHDVRFSHSAERLLQAPNLRGNFDLGADTSRNSARSCLPSNPRMSSTFTGSPRHNEIYEKAILKRMQVKLYDGCSRDFDEWIENLKILATLNGSDVDLMLTYMRLTSKTTLHSIFDDLQPHDWDDLVDIVTRKFSEVPTKYAAAAKISNLEQVGKSIVTHNAEFAAVARLSGLSLLSRDPFLIMNYVKTLAHLSIRTLIIRKIDKLNEAGRSQSLQEVMSWAEAARSSQLTQEQCEGDIERQSQRSDGRDHKALVSVVQSTDKAPSAPQKTKAPVYCERHMTGTH